MFTNVYPPPKKKKREKIAMIFFKSILMSVHNLTLIGHVQTKSYGTE